MDVRMYQLRHPRIAAVEMLQELQRQRHASAAVILMKKKGVGDAAGIDHPAEGFQKLAHWVRTELRWAMPARISFSVQSGKISRACTASLT